LPRGEGRTARGNAVCERGDLPRGARAPSGRSTTRLTAWVIAGAAEARSTRAPGPGGTGLRGSQWVSVDAALDVKPRGGEERAAQGVERRVLREGIALEDPHPVLPAARTLEDPERAGFDRGELGRRSGVAPEVRGLDPRDQLLDLRG